MIDIDFYQHLFLATWLFLIGWRWLNKQLTTLSVLGIALLWEMAEYFYNLSEYANVKHFLMDSLFDILAAVLAIIFCILILRKK